MSRIIGKIWKESMGIVLGMFILWGLILLSKYTDDIIIIIIMGAVTIVAVFSFSWIGYMILKHTKVFAWIERRIPKRR